MTPVCARLLVAIMWAWLQIMWAEGLGKKQGLWARKGALVQAVSMLPSPPRADARDMRYHNP
jgi:hypothetical protein